MNQLLSAHMFYTKKKSNRSFERSILSAGQITLDEVDFLCDRAADLVRSRTDDKDRYLGHTVALLFFQPSTRTRLGFEAAVHQLGCHTLGMQDMSASRSNNRTGESLEDCA